MEQNGVDSQSLVGSIEQHKQSQHSLLVENSKQSSTQLKLKEISKIAQQAEQMDRNSSIAETNQVNLPSAVIDKNLLKKQKVEQRFLSQPFLKDGFCTNITFGWIKPLIDFSKAGYSLNTDHLELMQSKQPQWIEYKIEHLKSKWSKYEHDPARGDNALFKSILSAFWKDFLVLVLLNIVSTGMGLLGPFIIKKLIDYIKTGKNPYDYQWEPVTAEYTNFDHHTEYGLALVAVLVISQGLSYIISEHITYLQNMTGTVTSSALVGLIFEKTLRLSPATNKKFKSGDLITFIQVDVQKLSFLCFQAPGLFKLPIILVVGFYFLYDYMGHVSLVGVLVFIIGFLSNLVLTRQNAKLQKLYMLYQGKRVSLTSECLSEIKTVKTFSLIEVFEQKIKDLRKLELGVQLSKFHIGMIGISFVFLFPQLMSTITIVVFVYLGNSLDLSTAYTIKIIFNYIKDPMRLLPLFIAQLLEFKLSMTRIQNFLVCDEINPSITNLNPAPDSRRSTNQPSFLAEDFALEFKNSGTFHWGIEEGVFQKAAKPGQESGFSTSRNLNSLENQSDEGNNNENNTEKKQMDIENSIDSSGQSGSDLSSNDSINSVARRTLVKELNLSQQKAQDTHSKSMATGGQVFKPKKIQNISTLKSINLKIQKGEFVCVIGDVGSGKSSLIQSMIGDLLYMENDFYKVFKDVEINQYLSQRVMQLSREVIKGDKTPIVYSQEYIQRNFERNGNGILAYAPQVPWIQNKTIRDNILFGKPYDEEFYNIVIKKCQLESDFEILPGGDQTELGQKGINLSGGQKARISLARAVYSERDIILMDDPISALDKKVLKTMFKDLFLGMLQGKTRILVTHSIEFLNQFDKIVLLKNGRISKVGTYDEVKDDFFIKKLKAIHKANQEQESALSQNPQSQDLLLMDEQSIKQKTEKIEEENADAGQEEMLIEMADDTNLIMGEDEMDMDNSLSKSNIMAIKQHKNMSIKINQGDDSNSKKHDQSPLQGSESEQKAFTTDRQREEHKLRFHKNILAVRNRMSSHNRLTEKEKSVLGKMTTNEGDEEVGVKFSTYRRYIMNYFGGWKFIFLSNLSIIAFTQCKLYNDYLLGVWSQNTSSEQHEEFYFYAYMIIGFSFLISFFVYLRAASMQIFSWYATRKLHEDMMHSVLNAPINLYFDKTPLGRILNIFSKDLNQLEIQMSYHMSSFVGMLYQLLSIAFVAIAASKYMALMIPFVFLMSIDIVQRTIPAIKETGKLFRLAKSPLLANIQDSMSGANTIRVYGRQREFISQNNLNLNCYILSMQMQQGIMSWFAIRIDFLSICTMAMISVACVLLRNDVSQQKQESISLTGLSDDKETIEPVLLSMLLSYVLTIQTTLVWVLKFYVQIESNMINAERCMNLCNIVQEKETLLEDQQDLTILDSRPEWPEQGEVEFKNVCLKYRPQTETVLRDLSFDISSGQKIGIVGRTGAGKTSIGLTLSRIVELLSGSIKIDGLDIAKVPLKQLRSRITVIPQEPTLFNCSLRFNLDPTNSYSDEDLMRVLKKANLQKILKHEENGLYQEISEGGLNFSSGERQLICVCRAILRKSKLILLDEATAFIDMLTEKKIQELISTEFKDSTMMTIAHRLNTIMGCDKVMVLSYGMLAEFDSPSNLMQDPKSEFNKFLRELQKKNN